VGIGSYELVEELGRGATGVVYRARHRQGHEVALKVLAAPAGAEARARWGVSVAPRTPAGAATGEAGRVALRALAADRAARFPTALALAEACVRARAGTSRAFFRPAAIVAALLAASGAAALAIRHARPAVHVGSDPGVAAPVSSAVDARAKALAARLDRALAQDAAAVARLLPELESAVARVPGVRAALAAVVEGRPADVYARLVRASRGVLAPDEVATCDLAVLVDDQLPDGSATPALAARERALADRLVVLAGDVFARGGQGSRRPA
jgi:hypothetical protein